MSVLARDYLYPASQLPPRIVWENLINGNLKLNGLKLEVIKVDERGRILIPKKIRERAKVSKGDYVRIKVDGKSIIIEPLESIAERCFGIFKVERWPEDIDEFLTEAIRKWLLEKST